MTRNWNTARPEPSVVELTRDVAALTKDLTEAVRDFGQDSREARNAQESLRLGERRLDAAKFRAAKFEEGEGLTPTQIVDQVMRR